MEIKCFLFNWPRQTQKAKNTYAALKMLGCSVTVINSDPDYTPFDWINLGNSAWFGQQWALATQLFQGDVMFHIQADAEYPDWKSLLISAKETFTLHNWGLYSPNLQHNNWGAVPIESWQSSIPEVKAVANPDCTCWFIHKDVVEKYRNLNLKYTDNYLGWGIDCVVSALSWQAKRVVLRDWRHTVYHHPGRGYGEDQAVHLMYNMFSKLPSDLYSIIQEEFNEPKKLLTYL
jgi:hypothetical protein